MKVPGTFTGTFTATSQSPKDWPSMCTDGYIPVYTGIYYVQTGICKYIPHIVCTDLYRSVYTGIYYVQTGICQYIPYIVCTDLYRSVYTGIYYVQTGIYQFLLLYTQIYCYVQDFVEHIVIQ